MTTIQINERGGLTLPKEMRRELGLEKGGVIMAEFSSEGILLKPAVAFPVEIYSDERIAGFDREEKALQKHLGKKARK